MRLFARTCLAVALTGCVREELAPVPMEEPAVCDDGIWVGDATCARMEVHLLDDRYADLVLGDFDGDGRRELLGVWNLFVSAMQGEARALELDAAGVYRGTLRYVHEGSFERAFVRDVDGDGRDDLIALFSEMYWSGDTGSLMSTAYWLRSTGEAFTLESRAGYRIPATPARMGDIDGDGAEELVVLTPVDIEDSEHYNRAYVYRDFAPTAKGYLEEHQTVETPPGFRGDLGDVDGDGRSDLVGVTDDGRVWTYFGRPDATLMPEPEPNPGTFAPSPRSDVTITDLDADGSGDLIWHDSGLDRPFRFVVARGEGDGTFTPVEAYEAPGPGNIYSRAHVLIDLDDSGYPAMIHSGGEGSGLVVFPQVGRLFGEERVDVPLPAGARRLVAEDVDGDGRRDLLVIASDETFENYSLVTVRFAW